MNRRIDRRDSVLEQDFPICYRLEPEKRLVPRFDSCCIAQFPVSPRGKMGLRVVDNCAEDNIQ